MKTKLLLSRTILAAIVQCGWLLAVQSATVPEALIAYAPDKAHLAQVGGDQGRIQYRRTSNNNLEGTFYICHAQALAFSPDGKLLAAAGGKNGCPAKVKVWRLGDHQQLCEIVTSGDGTRALALSRDGNLIAAICADGRVELWHVSGSESRWVRTTSAGAKSVRF